MGTVLLAAPRGYCAGVDRAVAVVASALERYGPPIYVRKQIVHNTYVVDDLAARGAVFVNELHEVPSGALVIFSAHGIAPAVRKEAAARGLRTIDATCPLVTKVHREAERFVDAGYEIILVGHPGHEEAEGTAGQAPGHIHVVDPAHAADLHLDTPDKIAWLSQTTLAVDETVAAVEVLRKRFPQLADPPSDDICYASQNRQEAVRAIAVDSDLVLVVGSPNSSNSRRLVEVALAAGAARAYLIDTFDDIAPSWLDDVERVGLTSGASVPEILVQETLDWLAERGYTRVQIVETTVETIRFSPPPQLRPPAVPRRPDPAS